MRTTVLFFEDGTHEVIEHEHGLSVHLSDNKKVKIVYVATGKEDVALAIDYYSGDDKPYVLGYKQEWEKLSKEEQDGYRRK